MTFLFKQFLVYIAIFFGALSLPMSHLLAQNVEYGVMLDTNQMMIGDQQVFSFQLRSERQLKIDFPILKDSLVTGVEILEGPVLDSLQEKDGKWFYKADYKITSFDTGLYHIPTFEIGISSNEYNSTLRTDPVVFAVTTYQVDKEKGNFDIVMPYDANWTLSEILPFLLWLLLGVTIIILIWFVVKRIKSRKSLFTPPEEVIPPFVLAIRALDNIKETKLWKVGKEKEYYTQLTDAVREYLAGEFGINAMEQTSSETIASMKRIDKITDVECDNISNMLSTADFVKFAKFTPLQDDNSCYLDDAYKFVNATHDRVEAERKIQETARRDAERAKLEKLKTNVDSEEHLMCDEQKDSTNVSVNK